MEAATVVETTLGTAAVETAKARSGKLRTGLRVCAGRVASGELTPILICDLFWNHSDRFEPRI